jgi:hypothetical protein
VSDAHGERRIALVQARGGFSGRFIFALAEDTAQLGVSYEAFEDGDPSADALDVVFLRGSPGWYPRTLRRLRSLPRGEQPRVLLWLTEPLPPPAASGVPASRRSLKDTAKIVLRDARANDQRTTLARTLEFGRAAARGVIAASTVAKVETLAEHGLDAPWVPLGARPVDGAFEPVERDIDVLFVGDADVPHRRRALRRLRRAGVDVTVRGAWHPTRGLWGDERRDLLLRTKVLLNVHRHPGNAADARLGLGAGHGAVTVSEPMYRPDPYVAGRDFLEAPLDQMPAVIASVLRDDDRRAVLAAAAAQVAREHTLSRTAEQLVSLMYDAR